MNPNFYPRSSQQRDPGQKSGVLAEILPVIPKEITSSFLTMSSALSTEEVKALVVPAVARALGAVRSTNCTCTQITSQEHVLVAYYEVRALTAVGRVSVSVGHGMVVFALSKVKDTRLYTTLDDWPGDEKIAGFLTFPVENPAAVSDRVNEMLAGAYADAENMGAHCVKKRLNNYLKAISLIL